MGIFQFLKSFFSKILGIKKSKKEVVWSKKPIVVKDLLDNTQKKNRVEVKKSPTPLSDTKKSDILPKIAKPKQVIKEKKPSDAEMEYFTKVTNFIANAKRDFTEDELEERKKEILVFLEGFKSNGRSQ